MEAVARGSTILPTASTSTNLAPSVPLRLSLTDWVAQIVLRLSANVPGWGATSGSPVSVTRHRVPGGQPAWIAAAISS